MQVDSRPGREDSRRDLMNVAIDCFARYGYAATSIDRIARAAGVTKGALYYHFKDKEELLFEAVKNRVGQFEESVVNDVVPTTDAAGALRKLMEICLDHATKSNHRRLIVTLMVEALDTNPRLEEQFRVMMQRFRAFLAGIIRLGQSQRQFRSDVDPQVAAEVFAASVIGAEIQYYQDPAQFNLSRALNTYVEQILGWLTPGVASRVAGPRRRSRRK